MEIKQSPTVSIVIPVYNEERVLAHAIKALKKIPADEIIFVDGGSTDQSRALVLANGYPCLKSPAGRAKQMNLGANSAKGDIILFLHIDTMVSSSLISNIKKSYNQGFLSGRFDIAFTDCGLTYRIISFFVNMRSRFTRISTGDQAMFVRRDTFEQLEGFKGIELMEDIELSKRLRAIGPVVCLRDKVITSNRRWKQNGLIKTVLLMWKLRFLYWLGTSPTRLAQMYKDTR